MDACLSYASYLNEMYKIFYKKKDEQLFYICDEFA